MAAETIVQNKLHYATHSHTTAELIYERVDASKQNVGMTKFHGEYPTRKARPWLRYAAVLYLALLR